jgi:hypothetical protein
MQCTDEYLKDINTTGKFTLSLSQHSKLIMMLFIQIQITAHIIMR